MKVLQRYFAIEIGRSVLFVIIALLALFSFFTLLGEMGSLKGGYTLKHAVLFVLFELPGFAYELMPIAALIGTIIVLARFASSSEFTIMRAASMSTFKAAGMLVKIGLFLVVITFLLGEFIAPASAKFGGKIRSTALGAAAKNEFRSGLWTKDLIREHGLTGEVIGSRFLNVQAILPSRDLAGLKVYEFDNEFRLIRQVFAERAEYLGDNVWRLFQVSVTPFPLTVSSEELNASKGITYPTRDVVSEITPDILAALFVDPDRMSSYNLALYVQHLSANKQNSERFEIALWKKLIYPFAVLVMMAIALPFAYLNARSGGVSLKIFSGIMIGMGFYLINSLFSHVGLLNTWPPFVTASFPSALFLFFAIVALRIVERR
jgi:lipopolysaccharide export system permease protein